uniref:C-type lectin domain-containing protein n=1 Tax=Denticeps clupeoides TaxID=299321 RepID=A0AAY3ZYS4_9TELE
YLQHFVFMLLMLFRLWFCSLCWSDPHLYYFVNETKTWTDAQLYCRDHYTDLATVDGVQDEKPLVGAVTGGYSQAWIGLHEVQSSWLWSDGSDSNYTNWAAGKPQLSVQQKLCGAVYTQSGEWSNEGCSGTLPFILSRQLNQCEQNRLVKRPGG